MMTVATHQFLGRLIPPFTFGVHVCSPEHSDLPLVQHLKNALWLGYADHIFLGVNKKALSLCTVASFKNFLSSELGS